MQARMSIVKNYRTGADAMLDNQALHEINAKKW